jgi:PTS system beta-glucosides-specific IIC component
MTAKNIQKYVGGEENIQNVTHCMTRLRFNLKDQNKVVSKMLESVPGVMGINYSGDQFQVIIGSNVSNVYKAIQ